MPRESCDPDQRLLRSQMIASARAMCSHRRNDHDDLRSICAPIDALTNFAIPFGWTGLLRLFVKLVAAQLKDSKVRIGTLAILPDGISIELRERGGADERSLLHSLASGVGRAAAAVDPQSGLLKAWALHALAEHLATGGEDLPLEFDGILSALCGRDQDFRRNIARQISAIRFGHIDGWQLTAPNLLSSWSMYFPINATCVQVSGVADLTPERLIAEPVIALGRLREWMLTVGGIYRLDRESWRVI